VGGSRESVLFVCVFAEEMGVESAGTAVLAATDEGAKEEGVLEAVEGDA
jgi:hypothetical protein